MPRRSVADPPRTGMVKLAEAGPVAEPRKRALDITDIAQVPFATHKVQNAEDGYYFANIGRETRPPGTLKALLPERARRIPLPRQQIRGKSSPISI